MDGTEDGAESGRQKPRGRRKRVGIYVVLAIQAATLVALAALVAANAFFNESDSVPVGFWRRTDGRPEKGGYVVVKTPDTDFARENIHTPTLLKKLAATEGDRVRIDGEGMHVNGQTLAKSKPLDIPGLKPAAMDRTLEEGEIIVHSDYNVFSYDSRYFGALRESDICAAAEPIYTWGTPNEIFDR